MFSAFDISHRKDWRAWGFGSVGILAALPASAQGLNGLDAGSLLRQEELNQREAPREVRRDAPTAALPEPAMGNVAGDRVFIKSVQFDGDLELLPEKERIALAEELRDVELDFAGLTAFTTRITQTLKNRGWFLARAYLPMQDLTDGNLTVSILSGRLDSKGAPFRIEEEPGASLRISKKRLQRMARAYAKPGEALSERDLTRALLIINDLPGVTARATLEPGEEPGSARVLLSAKQTSFFRPAISINNFGGENTGVRQITGSLTLNDPLGWGDRLTGSYMASRGLKLKSISYELPIGFRGLSLSGAYSHLGYESLNGPAQKAGLRGSATTIRLGLAYPLIRTVSNRITIDSGIVREQGRDVSTYAEFNDKTVQAFNLGLAGDVVDNFAGGGRTLWAVRSTVGKLQATALAARVVRDNDFDSYRTVGTFGKINFQLARLQNVVPRVTAYFNVQGQVANRNLDSTQKFYPTGPSALRAYPSGEASADQGALGQAELRYTLPLPMRGASVQLAAFYDRAQVWLHRKTYGVPIDTVSGRNSYALHGAGVGATVNLTPGASIRASWARPLGDNPGRAARQDPGQETTKRSRIWVQAGFQF